MKKFTTLTAISAPLDIMNIDTDMIIPKQFLKTIKRTGLGENLFHEMRTNSDGSNNESFVLNQPVFAESRILVAGENFGCGSSREHAPWALIDFGITCVIAPSFAGIFYNNCFENGVLPAIVTGSQKDQLIQFLNTAQDPRLTVDLESKTITMSDVVISFQIDDVLKNRLIKGLDSIGMTLVHEDKINQFEQVREKNFAWL